MILAWFNSSDKTISSLPTRVGNNASFAFQGTGLQYAFSDQTPAADNPVGWTWTFGDGNSSTSQNPTHFYATSGSYTVCLEVANDCGAIDTSCQSILVTSLNDPSMAQVDVFPNPNAGLFHVKARFTEPGLVRARVFDLTGRNLFEADWGYSNGEVSKQLSLDHLPEGSYILQMEVNGQSVNKMFAVSHP